MLKIVQDNEELFRKRLVFYDTETTGLTNDDKIVQISAISMEFDDKNNFHFVDCFNTLIKPETNGQIRKQSADSIRITGITDEMLENQPTFEEVIPHFLQYIDKPNTLIVAHNAKFDENMFHQELKRLDGVPYKNLKVLELNQVVQTYDSMDWIKCFEAGSALNLDAFASRFFAVQPKNIYQVENVFTGQKETVNFAIRAVTKEAKKQAEENKTIVNRHDALVDSALLGFVICSRFRKGWDASLVKDWIKLKAGKEFTPLNIASRPVKAVNLELQLEESIKEQLQKRFAFNM